MSRCSAGSLLLQVRGHPRGATTGGAGTADRPDGPGGQAGPVAAVAQAQPAGPGQRGGLPPARVEVVAIGPGGEATPQPFSLEGDELTFTTAGAGVHEYVLRVRPGGKAIALDQSFATRP